MDATGEGKLGSSSSNSPKSYHRTDSQASFSIHALVSRENSYQWDEFRRNELPSLSGSIPAGQEPLAVQIMQKIAVHLRHVQVESLATFLMHRGIINGAEHAMFLQQRRDWTSGMSMQDRLIVLLNERVKFPSMAKQCIPALYLSLRDSYEESSNVPTGNHYNVSISVVEEAKGCVKHCFKMESKTLDDEDPISELRAAVELIPQTEFEIEKADLLIQNLELQISSSEFEKFTSYQQICLHWLDLFGDSCTMGLLVSALVKSGLGKLSSGLLPVYRSNPPRFQSYVMNLSAMGHNWKSLAYFLGYKDTDPEIYTVDSCCPLHELKPRMFLRVFRIPDCEEEMESVVTEIISGVIKQKKVTENESNNAYSEWTKGGNLKVESNEASNIYLADGNTMQAQKDYNAPKVQQQNTSEITKSNLNQGSVSSSGSKDKSQTIKPSQKYYHPSSGPIKEKKTEVPTSKPKVPPAKEQKQLKAENSSAAHMKPEVPNPIKQQSWRPSPQPQNPPQPKSIVSRIPQPPSYNDRVNLLDLCMIGDDLCWPQVDRLLASMPILGEELESDEGKTAFHYVCRNGNIGRIRQMVARMANITHVDKCGRSVLHYNAVLTNQETLRIVLTGFRNKRMSVDVADNEGFLTPLMVVCTIGDSAWGSAKLLLEFGANPNGDQRAHSTPLIVACQSAAHNACPLVELLVNHGADVNKQDKDGYTLLLKACNTRKWNVAKYVLGLPQLTTINRSDRAGTNPLFEAVSQNNLEMAELLLRIGANTKIVRLQERNIPSLGSNSGVVETPFAHACRHGMLEMAKLLVAYHTDVNYKCSGVASALTFAAVNHKNNIVWYLLHECKGVDTSIYGLSTPISYSVKYKNHQCTKWMLDKLGGVEIAAQEADKVGMIDLFRDIEEYRLTCLSTATQVSAQHEQSHESDTFDTGLTSHRDEIEEVLYQFSKICINVVKSKINLSDLAGIASAMNPDVPEIGHFFQRCAKGHQNENSLKQDFLGPHKDVSPLSCVIQLQCISRQEFLAHTDMYFKGTLKPDEFVDRLVHTFHSISGDTETLPWDGNIVLDRLFIGQFSLSSISSQFDPIQSTAPSRSNPSESFRRDDVQQKYEFGWPDSSTSSRGRLGNIESPTIVSKPCNSGPFPAYHQPQTSTTPSSQLGPPITSTPRATNAGPTAANAGYNIQQSMATLNPNTSERESATASSMQSYEARSVTFCPPQLQQLPSIASESEESTVSLASSTYKDGIHRRLYEDLASNSVKKQPVSHDSAFKSSFERSNSESHHTADSMFHYERKTVVQSQPRSLKQVNFQQTMFHYKRKPAVVSNYYQLAKHYTHIPFIDPVIVFECDHHGGEYTLEDHGITIIIPEGAISKGRVVGFEIAVSLYGPFSFPENTRPISPILWLCPQVLEAIEFNLPIEVTLPHFLTGLTKHSDCVELGVGFAKANHSYINKDLSFSFEQLDYAIKPRFFYKEKQGYGTLYTTHCCFMCIGCQSKSVARSAGFCFTHIGYKTESSTYAVKFYVSFFLPSCLKALNMLFSNYCNIYKCYSHFTFLDQELEIILQQFDPPNLYESNAFPLHRKINMSKVDFWIESGVQRNMELEHELGIYPPSVDFNFRPLPQDHQQFCKVKVNVVGCSPESHLDCEISLPLVSRTPSSQNLLANGTSTKRLSSESVPPLNLKCQEQEGVKSHENRLRADTHFHKIYYFLLPHANLWRDIGLALGYLPNELSIIETNLTLVVHGPSAFLSEMLNKWFQWAPGDGRGSKTFATFGALRDALLRVPGTASIAYDLEQALLETSIYSLPVTVRPLSNATREVQNR